MKYLNIFFSLNFVLLARCCETSSFFLWNYGTMELWNYGTMELRNHGISLYTF